MEERQIIYNSVTCLECGETLVSYHRHDYKTCSCPQQTSVDGGGEYLRYGGKDLKKVQVNTLYTDDPFEIIREYVSRGGRGKNNDEPLKYVLLKDINDEWLDALIDYEEERRPNNPYLTFYKQEKQFRKDGTDKY